MMQFTAKWKGPPPEAQDQQILFNDCDTNSPTTDTPTTLLLTATATWLAAAFVAPDIVRVGVNATGMALGQYAGTVNVKIPDEETCEVGRVFPISVEMTVKKGKVRFQ